MGEDKSMQQMNYRLIRRSGMKNIRMRLQEDGTILVSAPYGVPREEIERALRESSGKLAKGRKSMDESRVRWENFVETQFSVRHIPKERIRKVGENFASGVLYEKGSILNGLPLVTDQNTFRQIFDAVYKNFRSTHPVALYNVTLRSMKTRWGSCRPATGRMSLNLLLLYVPERCTEYVIYHEFCHYLELNHSKRFWEQVEKYVPDYREREAELQKYGEILISHRIS